MQARISKLQDRSNAAEWKIDITYKITAQDMPQQNHFAELDFVVLANCGRALMIWANFPKKE
jgi:hypothetical protein